MRIEWIDHRLQNWARWKIMRSSGALGFASVDLQRESDREPWMQASIPVSDVEASDTDDAVQRLPGDLRATVAEYYVGANGIQAKLRRLVCSRATLHERLGRADGLLAAHFASRQEKMLVERQRVELLQRSNNGMSYRTVIDSSFTD